LFRLVTASSGSAGSGRTLAAPNRLAAWVAVAADGRSREK
jgi:hypothetical protein